jgi:phosphatidylserine decarboxylase
MVCAREPPDAPGLGATVAAGRPATTISSVLKSCVAHQSAITKAGTQALIVTLCKGIALSEQFTVFLQYLLPKQALTAFAGWVASRSGGAITTSIIRWFVGRYQVNMAEAANPDITSYATFNDFFTRALKPDARPLALARWICPVDGAISQFGRIEQNQIFQAKGHHYSTQALLADDPADAAPYVNGHFACLYLSPRDYHRIHMPCAGQLQSMTYVPGDLFSVNPATARGIPGLFARNERVVCRFVNDRGPFAMVLVGATIVGSMSTVWHGRVNPPRLPEVSTWRYAPGEVNLAQGAEMGRFLLGSTVVMVFPASDTSPLVFNPAWQAGGAIRLGEAMADAPH